MKQWRIKGCLRIICTILAVFGWWGLFFPEFTLNQDTVCIQVSEAEAESQAKEAFGSPSGQELLKLLLQAEPEQITYRSRLFTEIKLLWEDFSWDKLIWN